MKTSTTIKIILSCVACILLIFIGMAIFDAGRIKKENAQLLTIKDTHQQLTEGIVMYWQAKVMTYGAQVSCSLPTEEATKYMLISNTFGIRLLENGLFFLDNRPPCWKHKETADEFSVFAEYLLFD